LGISLFRETPLSKSKYARSILQEAGVFAFLEGFFES